MQALTDTDKEARMLDTDGLISFCERHCAHPQPER